MVMHVLRDFNKPQSQLFLLVASFLNQYKPLELQAVIDDDVVEAATAMAATFETASKGVIYEHRPTSLSAQRLMSELKPLLAEAGKGRRRRPAARRRCGARGPDGRLSESSGPARHARPRLPRRPRTAARDAGRPAVADRAVI
jgi:hypothetical protein